jgi:MtN3 and saliva related transmembrane protein
MNPELIGYLAGFLTTVAYVPQTLKILREKHTSSLSLGMYMLLTAGIASWFVYGWMIGSLPIMISNGIATLLTMAILIMKLKHG